MNHGDLIVSGIMQLIKNCPFELANIRKELLAISRHLYASDLKTCKIFIFFKIFFWPFFSSFEVFLPYIDIFFDENIFCSIGFTARDCLHKIYCSIVADYIHNVRRILSIDDVCKSMNCFSKYLIDQTITVNLHHMCCRILLNLLDCIKEKQESESCKNWH